MTEKSNMKSRKEVQLAAITFLRLLKDNNTEDLKGVFIPFSTSELYKKKNWLMAGIAIFSFLSVYMLYNAIVIDAVYYWHIDLPVIIGLLWISFYFIILFIFVYKFWLNNKLLKEYQIILMKPPMEF